MVARKPWPKRGRVRLRPIIMTTAAIVCAMLPLLFGQGAGAELRAPIAAVLVGGNITSTLLTLVIVPVVYNFFDWGSALVTGVLRKVLGIKPRQDEDAAGKGPGGAGQLPLPGVACSPGLSANRSA